MDRDLEVARRAPLRPIREIAARIGLAESTIEPHGWFVAKIGWNAIAGDEAGGGALGQLVAVTAMSPTVFGEGKTVTAIGLVDALNRLGRRALGTLRQPSLGPIFGRKGGASGAGRAQVAPREDINLHFTGDLHAVAAAQNLLAAMADNHLYHGNSLGLVGSEIDVRRSVDVNDRALRHVTLRLGRPNGGATRDGAFDLVAASEVMAALAQAAGPGDLKRRLARIVVGSSNDGRFVTAAALRAEGAMAALLVHALEPNLVQTLEGNPVLVHTGPFANVALGNSSVIADRFALRHAPIVVTEAGFGTECGFEKLVDVKCRLAGYQPEAAVVVVTVRALRWHGGGNGAHDTASIRAGCANLAKHLENVAAFGCPAVVAINVFESDSEEELRAVEEEVKARGATAVRSDAYRGGGTGALDLARAVLDALGGQHRAVPIYPLGWDLRRKIELVARRMYGAGGVEFSDAANRRIDRYERGGFGELPICIAKTASSLSHDPELRNRPEGFVFPIHDVRLYAGAGYVLPLAGSVVTMPGLPEVPAAESIDVDDHGRIHGV
jgi:formate--tetrahydrofolate ligase